MTKKRKYMVEFVKKCKNVVFRTCSNIAHLADFSIYSNILGGVRIYRIPFRMGTIQVLFLPILLQIGGFWEELLKIICINKPYFCNWQKWKKNWFEKYPVICFKELLIMHLLLNLSSFWFQIKLLLSHLEFSIFSNHSHLGWSSDISDSVRMGTTPGLFKAWFILAQWFLKIKM